jgi:LysM repeat protein
MSIKVKKSRHKLTNLRMNLLVVSLLFVLLGSSLLSCCVFMVQAEEPSKDVVLVSNEYELRTAIDYAVKPTVIVFTADIQLTSTSLDINAGKNIVLISSGEDNDFFKLIGVPRVDTITVNNGGVLELAGIIITHTNGATGTGVTVQSGGTLIMSGGEISGNTANGYGGGVCIWYGNFTMFDGAILNNTANCGGGIFSTQGDFSMFGGEISSNIAIGNYGGGVFNERGNFSLYDGLISGNTVSYAGGGVCSWEGDFSMFGGRILDNTAGYGGGVNICTAQLSSFDSFFSLFGGEISGNTAIYGGGVYICSNGEFSLFGGVISGNTANGYGGGVYIGNDVNALYFGRFSLFGGLILGNTANWYGGGVYNTGNFVMSDGIIANNNAIRGGGIDNCGYFACFNMSGGEVSGNTAQYGGGVSNWRGSFNLIDGWILDNIAESGGGINNDHGDLTMFGGEITNNTSVKGGAIYHLVDIFYIIVDSGTYFTFNNSFTMFDGAILSNNALDGGGIYNGGGLVELFGGKISDNTAANSGGGIWIASENMTALYVYDGVVFSNNHASTAYNRNSLDDAIYHAQIGAEVIWTVPFLQGYNNYDISYTNGDIIHLFYVVQPGDSLWFIARVYNTTVEALKALNGLVGDVIYPGQCFLLPRPINVYVVELGDTLGSVAQKCNTTVYTLRALNGLAVGEDVFVGQELQFRYLVQPGDSLWLISKVYNTTVVALKALNGLTSDTIYVGMLLLISDNSVVISAIPTAVVTQINGNRNQLAITVTEELSDGTTNTLTEVFSIQNNVADVYSVGPYKVYVDTKGNTQIRECYLVLE